MKKIFVVLAAVLLLVVIACSGGGGDGGDSGTTPPPKSTIEPTPPPPQASFTDNSGQVSFLTSQDQIVNFKVEDNDNQQTMLGVPVFFSERQNNTIFAVFEDSSGKYVPTIYLDTLLPASQSSASEIKTKSVTIVTAIVVGLTAISLAWTIDDFNEAIVRIRDEIKDFNAIGNNEFVGCKTVPQLAQLLWDRNAGAVGVANALLSIGGLEKTLFKIVGSELAKTTVTEITNWSLETLYKNGITSSLSDLNEKVAIKFFTMDAKQIAFYGAYEILPASEFCNVDNPGLHPCG